MKITFRSLILLIVLCVVFSGCTTKPNSHLYVQTISDLQNVVNAFHSNTFEEDFNNGTFVSPNNNLSKEWSFMLIDASNMQSNSFGYILRDINGDESPELFFVDNDRSILAIFTITNNNITLLDAFWSRHKAVIDKEGLLYIHSNGSASNDLYMIKRLRNEGGLEIVHEFGMDNTSYYLTKNGEQVEVDNIMFASLLESFPTQNHNEWAEYELFVLRD